MPMVDMDGILRKAGISGRERRAITEARINAKILVFFFCTILS